MSRHLLLLSLGPIQDFIASARRCQDLWFGSWLLSDLARATAKAVQDAAPGEAPLVFPAGLEREDKPAVANKILAILPEGKAPGEVADMARKAMQARLDELAQIMFAKVAKKHFNAELAGAQLDDLMELVWVAVPFAGPGEYAAARKQAEKLLAARKNTRTWGPVGWHEFGGAGVPKSSLDGMRESVIKEAAYDEFRDRPEALRKQYFVKPAERLCGVGLLKRLGIELPDADKDRRGRRRRPVFHSTSHVASAPILTRIAMAGEAGTAAVRSYVKKLDSLGVDTDRFKIRVGEERSAEVRDPRRRDSTPVRVPRVFWPEGDHGYDGYLLFEGRLNELLTEYCEGAGAQPAEKKLEAATAALAGLRRELGLREHHTTYYAYLLADGDAMGQAIDALALLPEGIEHHRRLGKALEDFAASCERLVTRAGGSLVYAGGDDVLALCPLHTALQLARALRDEFLRLVEPVFVDARGAAAPTISVGLGICHHMESMELARGLAKQAERAAKDEGRNALAVVVAKRSGGTTQVVRQWTDDDTSLDRWLVDLACWLERGELPDGLAFELERLIAPFEVTFGEKPAAGRVSAAVVALAQGVVRRKRTDGGKEDLPEPLAERLQEELEAVAPRGAVARLSDEIQVARLFQDGYLDAFGPLPEENAR